MMRLEIGRGRQTDQEMVLVPALQRDRDTVRLDLHPKSRSPPWFSQEACAGRCTGVAIGHAVCMCSTGRCPLCDEPLSKDPEHPPGRGVGLGGHDFGYQVGERLDAGPGRYAQRATAATLEKRALAAQYPTLGVRND
jgi:hypothetical protein